MRFFEPLLVAISTYSIIPVPQFAWNERNTKYTLCFLPAVGVLCGAGLLAWYALCAYLKATPLLFAAVGACVPLLITGGIHMDGYMDTVDALSSHQTRERKLEILKDPNCGAFAVIYCGIYLLLDVALLSEVYRMGIVPVLCLVFVLSRVLSALCAIRLPGARKNGMLRAFTQNVQKNRSTVVLLVLLVVTCGVVVALEVRLSWFVLAAAAIWTAIYRSVVLRQFGGVTGDTAGFFLQMCELLCLFGAWIGGQVL